MHYKNIGMYLQARYSGFAPELYLIHFQEYQVQMMDLASDESIFPAVVSSMENNNVAEIASCVTGGRPLHPRIRPKERYANQFALDKALEAGNIKATDEILRRGCEVKADRLLSFMRTS